MKEKSCGAVVIQCADNGHQILLVHHYQGHWGFPKGHVELDETEEETAKREVLEETGLFIALKKGFRHVVSYSPKQGIEKEVVYFLAQFTGGTLVPQLSELSELSWFSFEDARERLSHANDKAVLDSVMVFLSHPL